MTPQTKSFSISSRGNTDIVDITPNVEEIVRDFGISDGLLTVFVPGSTAGVTTIEFESGAVADLKGAFERMAPEDIDYAHNARWGDGNGHSHVRAAILGASLSVPVAGAQLLLGTWQQIVLVDFDNRPRTREVVVRVSG